MKRKVIGLTGSIASGKSTIANILSTYGYHIINADDITARLYKSKGKGSLIINNVFGKEYINQDGSVNKKRLKSLVFNNPDQLHILNSIMHPVIKQEIYNEITIFDSNIVIEAALLFEGELDTLCDEIWYIEIDSTIQKKRLKKRDSISDELIEKIINSQKSNKVKMDKVDRIIYNNGDIVELEQTVREAINE